VLDRLLLAAVNWRLAAFRQTVDRADRFADAVAQACWEEIQRRNAWLAG
jgi:hypothetical protein